MIRFITPYLKKQRVSHSLTQSQLGEKIGITFYEINRLENFKRSLTLKIAIELVNVFGQLTIIDNATKQRYLITKQEANKEYVT